MVVLENIIIISKPLLYSFNLNNSYRHYFFQLDNNEHTFLFRNLPPSPKAIITENPLPPPPRTSSSLAVNAISNDQLHKQKVFRHIHHNGPTSGILIDTE